MVFSFRPPATVIDGLCPATVRMSVLDKLEAERIREAFAEETDDPGWRAKSDLKFFPPNVLLPNPHLHFFFFLPPHPSCPASTHTHTPCGSHYGQLYFPSRSSECTCASPHISREIQSIRRGQSSPVGVRQHSWGFGGVVSHSALLFIFQT